MRRQYPVSLSGMTIGALASVAEQLAMSCRFIRAELEELEQIKSPFIAFWNLNHFVVVASVRKDTITIHDPARGRVQLSMAEASKCFTGLVIELTPTTQFQPIKAKTPISLFSILGSVAEWRSAVAQVLLIACALEVVMLIMPLQAQWILDNAVANSDQPLLITLSIAFAVLVCIQGGLTAARGWALSSIGASVSYQWVSNLFAHLTRLPMTYFERRHIGDVTSRFSSVEQVERTLSGNFIESMLDGASSCFAIVVLMIYSVPLGLIALAAVAVYALSRFAFYGRLWRVNEEGLVFRAKQQSELLESIRGIQAIKLSNRQFERRHRFSNVTMEAFRREVAVQRLIFSFASLNQVLFGLQRILIFCVAGKLAIEGKLTPGMMLAALAFAEQFTQRAGVFVDRCIEIRVLNLHLERIADIAMEPPEEDRTAASSSKPPVDHSWELRNISFRYSESEPWIIKDLSLHIPHGKSVAIVGPSGSGKTTLAKIILGLLKPNEGSVHFGSLDLTSLGATRYRDLVSAVMQNDNLFAGSIGDNITFFDSDPDYTKMERAARQASIHDEIANLPMRYDTLVGDMGSTLSGGQKQRVLLARAIYRNPVAIVLDEATSHLDSGSEATVNREVSQLHMTRLIIAHREDTIAMADYVYDLSLKSWREGCSPYQFSEYQQAQGTPIHRVEM